MYSLQPAIKSKEKVVMRTLMALFFLLASGCDYFEPWHESGNSLPKQVESLGIIIGLTVDADGNTVNPETADPATLLYYRRTELPVLGPDKRHITAGEWAAAEGIAVAKCNAQGTQVSLHFRGLIPKAIYRIWILTFKEPGHDRSLPNPFINVIGAGALGPNDRSRNTFRASANGTGSIVRFIPEGEFSDLGFAEACQITDVFEWHVVGAFQQPGQPHGPDVGPDINFPGSAVSQFAFVFKE